VREIKAEEMNVPIRNTPLSGDGRGVRDGDHRCGPTEDLTIRFGGHAAVDGVSCAFQPGTLTAIVGPNGAGKTTYFNLISGQLQAHRRPGLRRRPGRHRAEPAAAAQPRAAWAAPSS
jgi:ABC-type hemin transport system ATPase subunit